jgi:hypothetical protein
MQKIYKRKIIDYLFDINDKTFNNKFTIYYGDEFSEISRKVFDNFQFKEEIEVFENECSKKILEFNSIDKSTIEWNCPEISKCERIKLLQIERDLKRLARKIYNENSFFDKLLPQVYSLITYSEIDLNSLYKKRVKYFIARKLKRQFNLLEQDQTNPNIPLFFPEELGEIIDDFVEKVEISNQFQNFDDEFYTKQLINDIFFLSNLEDLYTLREKDEFIKDYSGYYECIENSFDDYYLREIWKISRERAETIYDFDKSLREIANEIFDRNDFFQEIFGQAVPLIKKKIIKEEKSFLSTIRTFLSVNENLDKVLELAKSNKLGKVEDIEDTFSYKEFFIITTDQNFKDDEGYYDKVAITDDIEFVQTTTWLFRHLAWDIMGVVDYQNKFEFFGRLGYRAVESFHKELKKEFIYIDVIEEARKIRKDWEETVFDNFKKNLAIHEKALEWIKEH